MDSGNSSRGVVVLAWFWVLSRWDMQLSKVPGGSWWLYLQVCKVVHLVALGV